MANEKRLIDLEKAKKDVMGILAGKVSTVVAVKVGVAMQEATVDAVEVVHGWWIPTYHTYYNRDGEYQIADEWHCSKCEIYSRSEWHYCPNCGAKMDGGNEDA